METLLRFLPYFQPAVKNQFDVDRTALHVRVVIVAVAQFAALSALLVKRVFPPHEIKLVLKGALFCAAVLSLSLFITYVYIEKVEKLRIGHELFLNILQECQKPSEGSGIRAVFYFRKNSSITKLVLEKLASLKQSDETLTAVLMNRPWLIIPESMEGATTSPLNYWFKRNGKNIKDTIPRLPQNFIQDLKEHNVDFSEKNKKGVSYFEQMLQENQPSLPFNLVSEGVITNDKFTLEDQDRILKLCASKNTDDYEVVADLLETKGFKQQVSNEEEKDSTVKFYLGDS